MTPLQRTIRIDVARKSGESRNDASRSSDRRGGLSHRHKTCSPTSLRTPDGTRRAHVLNISCTGAKLHADIPAGKGEMVEILLLDIWRRGLVMWSRGREFGIAFAAPIPDDVLTRYLSAKTR